MTDIGFEPRILIIFAVQAYRGVLFAYILLSILQSMAGLTLPELLRPAARFVYDICEPFLRVFRGLLPAVRLGAMGLDLSPIIAFIVLYILERILIEVLF
ncbi:MAG TPA: YggT family protein [Actinomycetota bacterium]|jgi:YggT family protein|nr:YggT family protein [Actinomycetota bacterium]